MRYLLTTIFIFISSTLLAYNISQATDSLLHLLNTASPAKKNQIYRNLADIHLDTADAKMYLLKMYNEAKKINDRKSMLSALHDIVIDEVNANIINKDTIVKYINNVKEIAAPEELKVLLSIYNMRVFEALCYLNQNEEAIKEEMNFYDSKTTTEDDIYREIASTYNIGNGFYLGKEIQKSIPYLEKAHKMLDALSDYRKFELEKIIIRRLCYAYTQTGKEKESVEMMEDLINRMELDYNKNYKKQRPFYKIDSYRLQYYSFMFTSLPFLTLEQEKHYWELTLQIGKNLTSDFDKYNYYLCANNYYSNNHTKLDIPKAIAANDSLIKLTTDLAPRNLPGLYSTNSLLYEYIKDYLNALKYLKASYHIRDSITSETSRQQLNELQVKYDVNTLNSENAKLELKNKKIMLISLSILLIIVITICTYLYFSLKKEKRMKMELKVLHSKAQESEKMKQAFINSICHEIRTPLNAIVGFSDLIMNEDIDEEMRREFPAEIQKSTVLLTSLVNSMLEVANLDVSEEKLPCEPTDLRGICIQEMERIKRKDEIEYKIDIPEDSMMIPTNAEYLAQVIEHLLNNANKFTEKGKITLSYQVHENKKKIFINVTDTGCGIPLEKHEEVFNRFSKLDTFVQGNGLGLYLCRLIVKRLAGEIMIDPNYTEGTRITVILPIT